MDKNAIVKALRDTAQSASNAVASNVSAPVDLLAMALRGIGLPIPRNPMGGSQWMAEKGLTRDVEMGVPRIVGETLGMAGPMVAAARAPQIASGINQMAENAMAPRTLNPQTGAIVWHGSPHKFDKFDSSKIGTGEGAQAYGHGLYLAESPEVAKGYQKTLASDGFLVGDKVFDPASLQHMNVRSVARKGDVDAAIAKAKELASSGSPVANMAAQDLARLQRIKAAGGLQQNTGSLYKVDLPDDQIAKMLDWDKPLSQQAPEVQKAWGNFLGSAQGKKYAQELGNSSNLVRSASGGELTGESLLKNVMGANEANSNYRDAASAYFRDQGIPGIRYLDSVSRGAGQGSSNFVVFPGNEELLKILERNGQPIGLMGIK